MLRMILDQVLPDTHYNLAIVLGTVENVGDLLLCVVARQHELARWRAIDFHNVCRVESEDRNGPGSWRFEEAWRDQPHLIKRGSADDWIEPRASHPCDDVFEGNRLQELHTKTLHVRDVGVVGIFHLHG